MKKKRLRVLGISLLLASTLVFSNCGFGAKNLARQASDLTKQAEKIERQKAELQMKAAEIEEKAANLSDKNKMTYNEELARLGFMPQEWLFNDAEPLFSGSQDIANSVGGAGNDTAGGIGGLFARIFSGGGEEDSASARGGSGGGNSESWPPNSVLSKYGIGGMPQPTGVSVNHWAELVVQDKNTISIFFTGTPATHTAVRNWLTNNGFVIMIDMGIVYFQNSATGADVSYMAGDAENSGLLIAGYHIY